MRQGNVVDYQIKLDSFEGPMDLLLHLIEKEEMDIYDIKISKITDQYLEYIHTMQTFKLDITSEFIVMAARLLALKSKLLLPIHEPIDTMLDYEFDEADPREELIQRLIEYKKYKEISGVLKEMEIERSKIYTRPPGNLSQYLIQEEENPVEGISIYHLIDAFERALIKYSYKDPLTKVEREEISVKDRMNQIINLMIVNNGIIHFSDIIVPKLSRSEIVVTFLSILELMKQKVIFCVQTKTFDDIVIHHTPKEDQYGLQ